MNTQDLQRQLFLFESVLKARLPGRLADSGVARALRELYATQSASAILSSMHEFCQVEDEITRVRAREEDQSSLRPPLPSLDAVRSAVPRLLEAVALQDGNGAAKALGEMGVLALCSPPEQVFSRLEFSVGLSLTCATLFLRITIF